MPTHEEDDRFRQNYRQPTPDQRVAFRAAVYKLVDDLRRGTFRKGLRVKRVQGHPGDWEKASDGRATFSYGASVRPNDPHFVWHSVGSHDIFDDPGTPHSQN